MDKQNFEKAEDITWKKLQTKQFYKFKIVKRNLIFNVSMYF